MEMFLGAHIGTSDGLAEAARTGRSIGCEAIQIFTKSPHSWKGPPVRPEAAEEFRAERANLGLQAVSVHHNYLTNLASPKNPLYFGSRTSLIEELARAEMVGADHVIFHPGAHCGSGVEAGRTRIIEALNAIFAETATKKVRLLLENAAGQGTALGSTFEELALLLDGVGDRSRVGVAIDTCHLFAAGNDFRTEEGYGSVKDAIGATIGARAVFAFHLNDSKSACGKHVDRHENIGRGEIGVDGFAHWLNDRTWAKVPGYLETPLRDDDYAAYVEDLRTLRSLLRPAPKASRPKAK
jgi:deoxyribonuclease-4